MKTEADGSGRGSGMRMVIFGVIRGYDESPNCCMSNAGISMGWTWMGPIRQSLPFAGFRNGEKGAG